MTGPEQRYSSLRYANGAYPLIAIDGPGGAGKTTLTDFLTGRYPGVVPLHSDDYFEPLPGPIPPGFTNRERLASDIGPAVVNGDRRLTYRPYDWKSGAILLRNIDVSQGVLIEGVRSWQLPFPWDFKIWIDAPREERLRRCVEVRTNDERRAASDSIAELATRFAFWADDADAYRDHIQPELHADLIIDGQRPFADQLSTLETVLPSGL
jgi:hypothetical protein